MARLFVMKNGVPYHEVDLIEGQEYIAGRVVSCQIVLDDDSVSRHHFKISHDSSGWRLERLSKFGTLLRGDEQLQIHKLADSDNFVVPPFQFRFENKATSTVLETANNNSAAQTGLDISHSNAELNSEGDEDNTDELVSSSQNINNSIDTPSSAQIMFENNNNSSEEEEPVFSDDKTSEIDRTSAEIERAKPYITMKAPGSPPSVLRLEGVTWTAGRDETCEIKIDDKRSSRKHFKIYKDASEYYIQDLTSSNGTFVNGDMLNREPKPLESGDEVYVGDTLMVFELKDPNLEKELNNLPIQLDIDAAQPQMVYLPINLEAGGSVAPAQGVIRLDQHTYHHNTSRSASSEKNKKIRFALVLMIALIGTYYLVIDDGTGKKTDASSQPAAMAARDPFERLTPQEQEFVRRTYKLAESLYMQTKYELALAEIRKIHERIPSYLKSKEIESLSEAALATIKNKQYEEEVERKQKEALQSAKKVVEMCNSKFAKSLDIAAIEACLTPALEIDPENQKARLLVENAKNLIEQKNLEASNKAEFQRRIKQRENLYQQAKKLQTDGKLIDAIETYERHIASTLPDPQNLAVDSKRNIDSIKGNIHTIMEGAIQAAESHLSNSEYKEAVMKLEKALELDPNHSKARQIYEIASKELFKKMKSYFSDAVVEESLGNIESAKVKWKKILDQDIPRGEYRNKASIKLRKYGE